MNYTQLLTLINLKISILETTQQTFDILYHQKVRPTDNIGLCPIMERLVKRDQDQFIALGIETMIPDEIVASDVFPEFKPIAERWDGNIDSATPFFWDARDFNNRMATLDTMILSLEALRARVISENNEQRIEEIKA